jgi:predicted amino acid dehydrogenase
MSIVSSVGKIGEAIAVWLNPERKEKVILRRAIEAADQLLLILRREGRYKEMKESTRNDLERHYQKQFDAWKDGAT